MAETAGCLTADNGLEAVNGVPGEEGAALCAWGVEEGAGAAGGGNCPCQETEHGAGYEDKGDLGESVQYSRVAVEMSGKRAQTLKGI